MAGIDPESTSDLTGVEARLRSWLPQRASLDRDQLLYEAGRAASRFSPLSAGTQLLLALTTIGLAFAWWNEHDGRNRAENDLARLQSPKQVHSRHDHELDGPEVLASKVDANPASYLALRQLLTEGIEHEARNSPNADSQPPSASPPSLRAFDRNLDL
jgi:hypothetical protein